MQTYTDNDDFMGYVSMNIRDLIDVDYHDGLQQEHSFDVPLLSHTNGSDAEQNANDDMGTIQLKMTLNTASSTRPSYALQAQGSLNSHPT